MKSPLLSSLSLIPWPSRVRVLKEDGFRLDSSSTRVRVSSPEAADAVGTCLQQLRVETGSELAVADDDGVRSIYVDPGESSPPSSEIRFEIDANWSTEDSAYETQTHSHDGVFDKNINVAVPPPKPLRAAESYTLTVRPTRIVIRASAAPGLFYGCQTLRQLLDHSTKPQPDGEDVHVEVPSLDIFDAPRFLWRGCLLDVARHFMPLSFVFKFVDLLALHKMNVLHLHLTDDQGWRVDIVVRINMLCNSVATEVVLVVRMSVAGERGVGFVTELGGGCGIQRVGGEGDNEFRSHDCRHTAILTTDSGDQALPQADRSWGVAKAHPDRPRRVAGG